MRDLRSRREAKRSISGIRTFQESARHSYRKVSQGSRGRNAGLRRASFTESSDSGSLPTRADLVLSIAHVGRQMYSLAYFRPRSWVLPPGSIRRQRSRPGCDSFCITEPALILSVCWEPNGSERSYISVNSVTQLIPLFVGDSRSVRRLRN